MAKDRRYFVDTGAWVAFYNDRDQWHQVIRRIFRELAEKRAIIITSEEILLETMTLPRTRVGYSVAKVQEIIDRIRTTSTVISTKRSDNLKQFSQIKLNTKLLEIECKPVRWDKHLQKRW